MGRWAAWAGAAGSIVALSLGVAFVGRPAPSAEAQDGLRPRIAALETTVAQQGVAIATLQAEVASLDGNGAKAAQNAVPAQGGLTFEGTTDQVTQPFNVREGHLRFDATYQGSDNFIVWIYGQDDSSDLVFNELGPYQGQRAIAVAGSGDIPLGVRAGSVFLAIQGTGPWRIAVSQ
jgi:hypothetical protein